MNLQTLPRHVVIGKWVFTIEVLPKELEEELDDNLGFMCCESQRIVVREELRPKLFLDTLLHEIVHAINWQQGVTDESDEETFTARLSSGFLQMQLENPRLAAWLHRAINELRKEQFA